MQVEVCVQDCFEEATEPDRARSSASAQIARSIPTERWDSWFQQWLAVLHPDLSPVQAYELTLRLTDDREIQELNSQFRQQDKPTDVLAFAALEATGPQSEEMEAEMPLYLGDIVISVDTAQRQAQTQAHPVETEMAWLAAHGLLHLLGWDHPDEESLLRMLDQQQVLLNTVGLTIKTS